MKYYTRFQLYEYMLRVGDIDAEIKRIQECMVGATKHPHADKAMQTEGIARFTEIFQHLLAEKARKEIVQQVRQNDTGNTENSSAGPTDNTPRSIGIGNILKEKIARS